MDNNIKKLILNRLKASVIHYISLAILFVLIYLYQIQSISRTLLIICIALLALCWYFLYGKYISKSNQFLYEMDTDPKYKSDAALSNINKKYLYFLTVALMVLIIAMSLYKMSSVWPGLIQLFK